MNQPLIDFKKEREFGDVMNATFAFIGQEFKPLGRALLFYAIPVILLAGIAMGFFQSKSLAYSMNPENIQKPFGQFVEFGGLYLIVIFMTILYQSMVITTLYVHINLYVTKGKDNFTIEDVRNGIAKRFLHVLGALVVLGFLSLIGFIFCIIPGIYLGVSLSVMIASVIFENKSIGEGFGRSFDLTKLSWWWTLLLLFVTGLIVGILASIISVPMAIIGIGSAFSEISKGGQPPESFKTFIILYSVVSSILTTLLYTILYTAIAFQFFNLVE